MIKVIDAFPKGIVKIPPSKSVAHRALICALLANGESTIKNLDLSEDIKATLNCMQALGATVTNGQDCKVTGGLKLNKNLLDCNESGSTLRFFIPIAALLGEKITFTGKGRLLSRPLEPYFKALSENGVKFEKYDDKLTISGQLKAGKYSMDGNISSQFITGLLFALPLLDGDSVIELNQEPESCNYIALTIDALSKFNVIIEHENFTKYNIKGNSVYKPQEFEIEADFSQAAFFLVAAALGSEVCCSGLNMQSLQGDKEILDILVKCGAKIEPTADGIKVKADKLKAITVDASQIPDLVPVLAVLLSFCEGESKIVNAGRLRMKESDRLFAITTELNKLGAKVAELEDALIIKGVSELTGGEVNSHNDHRIAMAMSVAAIKSTGTVVIQDAQCINKSYPNFYEDFCKSKEIKNV